MDKGELLNYKETKKDENKSVDCLIFQGWIKYRMTIPSYWLNSFQTDIFVWL